MEGGEVEKVRGGEEGEGKGRIVKKGREEGKRREGRSRGGECGKRTCGHAGAPALSGPQLCTLAWLSSEDT